MSIASPACPKCGATLRGRQARGLCPRCLLGTVLRGPDDAEARPEAEQEAKASGERKIHAFGDYELVRELGRGGMGIVYEARHLSLQRRVALKMVLPARLASPTDVERFRLEAEAVASLDHPGILPIYNIGTQQGQHYFTMKLVEGGSVADWIASRPKGSAPRPRETFPNLPIGQDLASSDRSGQATTTQDPKVAPQPARPRVGDPAHEGSRTWDVDFRQVAALVEQVARAVHYAHQHGIQHRDIKPGNILLDVGGHPFVSDFGLAKFIDRDTDLTRTTTVMGSPYYMSPEQAAGQVRSITTATDIYSLGAVLFELLCGRPPFRGPTALETMRLLTAEDAPSPRRLNPKVDRDLETICLKCLSKEPQRRYASAEALAEDLQRWLKREPIAARPVAPLERAWRWCLREPALAALGVLLIFAILAGLTGVGVQWRRAEGLALSESQLRRLAETNEHRVRLGLYAADMNVAAQAAVRGDLGLARRTLQAHRPATGTEDLRGFEWRYLWGQTRGDQFAAWPAHDWIVTCLAFSPDGSRFASGAQDGKVKVWDTARHALLAELATDHGAVWSVAFTPDQRLLSAGSDGKVRLWNVATGVAVAVWDGKIAALAASNSILAIAQSSPFVWEPAGPVSVWNYRTNEKLLQLPEPGRRVSLSADGKTLATAGPERGIKLWDVPSGKLRRSLETPDSVWSMAFSPAGDQLAAAGWENGVLVWDLARPQPPQKLQGHSLNTWWVTFSPDGQTLASTGSDQTIRLWETRTWRPRGILRGQGNEVWCAAFSPDGTLLASGSKDQTIALWRTDAKAPAGELAESAGQQAALSPDGRWVVRSTSDGTVTAGLWDLQERKQVASIPAQQVLCFSRDGREVICLDAYAGTLAHWAIKERRFGKTVPLAGAAPGINLEGWGHSPDLLACFGWERSGRISVWSLSTGARLGQVQGPAPPLRSVALAPDGRALAVSIERENDIRLFDVATGRERQLAGHRDFVSGLAFSPDGRSLASGSVDATIKLWDVALGQESGTLTGHMQEVTDLVYAPDGRTLVSVESKEGMKWWHLATRREMARLAFPDVAASVRFSLDGSVLMLVTPHGRLRVYEVPPLSECDQATR